MRIAVGVLTTAGIVSCTLHLPLAGATTTPASAILVANDILTGTTTNIPMTYIISVMSMRGIPAQEWLSLDYSSLHSLSTTFVLERRQMDITDQLFGCHHCNTVLQMDSSLKGNLGTEHILRKYMPVVFWNLVITCCAQGSRGEVARHWRANMLLEHNQNQ